MGKAWLAWTESASILISLCQFSYRPTHAWIFRTTFYARSSRGHRRQVQRKGRRGQGVLPLLPWRLTLYLYSPPHGGRNLKGSGMSLDSSSLGASAPGGRGEIGYRFGAIMGAGFGVYIPGPGEVTPDGGATPSQGSIVKLVPRRVCECTDRRPSWLVRTASAAEFQRNNPLIFDDQQPGPSHLHCLASQRHPQES